MNAERYNTHRHTICLAACAFVIVATGCQGKRLFSPMASRSMDTSPPQMHGPSTLHQGMDHGVNAHVVKDASGQVRVTSEAAVPETSIAPVEQRLATVKSPKRPIQQSGMVETNDSADAVKPIAAETVDQPANETIQPTSYVADDASFEVPAEFGGVDVSELMKALQDAPPEIQKAAIGRLIAMSRKRAQPTAQPLAIEDALAASFDSLPELPDEVIDRGMNPVPLASGLASTLGKQQQTQAANSRSVAKPNPGQTDVAAKPEIAKPTGPSAVQPIQATQVNFNDAGNRLQTVSAEEARAATAASQNTMVLPSEMTPTEPVANSAPTGAQLLSDSELYDALVDRLQKPSANETEAERQRRVVMARHLLVLAGDPDRAVEKIEGLSNEEEEFLRHQLLGLWTIIDPNGHPVPSRRLSSALPEMRKATGYLAAASDTLEVRGLEFCTEIEAYGEVTPFESRRFEPGQEVILYCEVENFKAAELQNGFETRLRGSYDLIDEDGRRISSQTLPEDRQVSKNWLRDYFVAYQMYLPDEIESGRYQLRLTMEDVHGKKYGQSTVDFQIKR